MEMYNTETRCLARQFSVGYYAPHKLPCIQFYQQFIYSGYDLDNIQHSINITAADYLDIAISKGSPCTKWLLRLFIYNIA